MNLNTKIEYAIRALTELAIAKDRKPITIKQICSRQKLPVKYMEQIFRKLKNNGLIKSVQGASGGYVLITSPDRLSIKDIMSAVEDEPVKLECLGEKGYREFCTGQPCHFYIVWEDIKKDLETYFNNVPLSRFINLSVKSEA